MHKYVTIEADVMFVNGFPFLVASLREIRLVTIEFLPSRTESLAISIERDIKIYARTGFNIHMLMMDMKFEKLKDMLPEIAHNTMAAREHVGEIERNIRVIKERAMWMINTLPHNMPTKLIITEMMHFCVIWMNSFPFKSGISEKYSLRELVSRHRLDAKLHRKTPFGAYCKVQMDAKITNTMQLRTRWGICLRPTRNLQGSYKFMMLTMGKKIVCHKFTEMPTTKSVIRQVLTWAGKDHALTGLKFMNKYGVEYDMDEEEDEEGLLAREEETLPFPDVLAEAPGMMTKYEKILDGDNVIEGEPITNDMVRAVLAAENSGQEFGPIEAREGR
jgi:hypothetical protein